MFNWQFTNPSVKMLLCFQRERDLPICYNHEVFQIGQHPAFVVQELRHFIFQGKFENLELRVPFSTQRYDLYFFYQLNELFNLAIYFLDCFLWHIFTIFYFCMWQHLFLVAEYCNIAVIFFTFISRRLMITCALLF